MSKRSLDFDNKSLLPANRCICWFVLRRKRRLMSKSISRANYYLKLIPAAAAAAGGSFATQSETIWSPLSRIKRGPNCCPRLLPKPISKSTGKNLFLGRWIYTSTRKESNCVDIQRKTMVNIWYLWNLSVLDHLTILLIPSSETISKLFLFNSILTMS